MNIYPVLSSFYIPVGHKKMFCLSTISSYFCASKKNNRTAKSVLVLNQRIMKKGIHPESYRYVVFKDMSVG
jgi:hypothetical protein